MNLIISIALGGSIGALARYFLSIMVSNFAGGSFPWGTMTVNLTGSFLIGFFYDFFEKTIVSMELRSFIAIGFIGAFTTFSTFAIETLSLFRDGEIKLGLLNIFISNILGLVFALAGLYASGILIHK